jgi:hypothetical protein
MTVASAGQVSFSPWWNLKSNTRPEPLPEAGARYGRTLEGVACKRCSAISDPLVFSVWPGNSQRGKGWLLS